MTGHQTESLLVADVGGTNTRIALLRDSVLQPCSISRLTNNEQSSLPAVLDAYRARQNLSNVAAACVAVAGPVQDGVARLTNLNWQIDHASLKDATGARRTLIINDLQAQAFALQHLPNSSFSSILLGQQTNDTATKLVIGIGTGCNAAVVLSSANSVHVPASETGHKRLPLHNQHDLELAVFFQKTHGFASVEHVLSGVGLEAVYRFYSGGAADDATPTAPQICEALASGSDKVAAQAVETVVHKVAHVCADLALIHLPFGGIYLTGGVARALTPYFLRFGFAEHFYEMGRFAHYMQRFPISLVTDDYAGLIGCGLALNSE